MKKFATRIVALLLVALLAITAMPAGSGGVVEAAVVKQEEYDSSLKDYIEKEKDTLSYTFNPSDGVLTVSGTDYMGGTQSKYAWDSIYASEYAWHDDESSITKVIIESGVKSIGGKAFVYASSLNEVVIADTVGYIGKWAFASGSEATITFNGNAPEISSSGVFGTLDTSGEDPVLLPNDKLTIKIKEGATGFLDDEGKLAEDWAAIKNDYDVKFILVKNNGDEKELEAEETPEIEPETLDITIPATVHIDDTIKASIANDEKIEEGYRYYWSVVDSNGKTIDSDNFYADEVDKPYEFSAEIDRAGKATISVEVRAENKKGSDAGSGPIIAKGTKEFTVSDHDYSVPVANSAKAVTCTVAGKEADMKCSICGDVKAGAVIKATGHKEVSKTVDGKIVYTCSVCGEETRPAEIIPVPAEPAKKGETFKIETGDKKAEFKVTNDGKNASVTYTKTTSTSKKVSIPATVKDASGKSYKVTAIAKDALKGNTKVTEVKVGKNVTTIGASAFQKATKLKTVNVEGKLTKIDKNAFSGAKSLKSVTINGNSLKSVGKNAFKGVNAKCKITIQAKNKTQYNKIVKMIKKSGAKKVAFKFKKKK